ncbi:MAG: type VI secretion system contractile sheath large subunit [Gammaproteobacteria bacterium]|nr:type VI secretion system contractile sheath large subunit [Gammaproteobacteria bacterium]MDH5727615.1 type VI secretion system contractile sheath large subunit [Gammaproteobacteria bacterium]
MSDAEVLEDAAPAAAEAEEGSLLDLVMTETKIRPEEEAYGFAKRGIEIFLGELARGDRHVEKVDKDLIDQIIASIDEKLGIQVNEILHHPELQKMESAWRGLKLVIDRTDFRENIKVEMCNVSKDDLLADFEDFPDITKSGLYRHAYTANYGQFGGEPVGMMIGNYEFGPGAQDIKLLRYCASVAAMAHAPFIGAVSPTFFGVEDIQELPNLKDIGAIFESPIYAKWHGFRESEDARYVGLTMPRFLMRVPYSRESNPVKGFDYEEDVSGGHDDYLWGNTSYAFATRLTESFAKYRWCPNIIGPQSGGTVDDLPLHHFESMGEIETKIPTEVLISDRREYELSEQGFIPLTMRKGSDNACFFSANSVQKPKKFSDTKEGKEAETNYKLGTQLPYMFIISRLAHYIKVLQREQIGSWKNRVELNKELNDWIRQYVSDQENPSAAVRSRRPLRKAEIVVSDVDGDPGWYRVDINVVPHFKYMGANFTLSLKGKLDTD